MFAQQSCKWGNWFCRYHDWFKIMLSGKINIWCAKACLHVGTYDVHCCCISW